MTEQIGVKWYAPFLSWQIWGMAVAGLLGIFLTQNAFHAGPVTASQSTLVIVDPLVSLLIGIGLFGDNLQTAGARGPLESLSLIVLFGGRLLPCKVAARGDRPVGRRGGDLHSRVVTTTRPPDCSERRTQLRLRGSSWAEPRNSGRAQART